MKFLSIPVEVEAVQFNGFNHNEIEAFAGNVVTWSYPDFQINVCIPIIETKEGKMSVSVGDYVVKEPFPTGDRDFYPCKKDIFEKRYQRLTDEG